MIQNTKIYYLICKITILATKKPTKRKYNRKPKNNMIPNNNDQPSKRTRSSKKISDLAVEFLEHESDIDSNYQIKESLLINQNSVFYFIILDLYVRYK